MRRALIIGVLSALAIGATAADAQERGRRSSQGIPPGHLPPPGMCRVWYNDRPPGQQPAPTNCQRAEDIAEGVRGARVIYGGNVEPRNRDDDDRRESDHDDGRRGECDQNPDYCLDRNHDGLCDGVERPRPDECVDRDGDGRCDAAENRTGPEMVWGVLFGRGERVDDLEQWIPSSVTKVRYEDDDRNGVPEVVSWLDSNGQILIRWLDTNRDGRADRIGLYQNGKLIRETRP